MLKSQFRLRVYPVLDLLGGVCVRGVGGQRDAYVPLASPLARGPEPILVARAFRETFQLNEMYVADLDGILHSKPSIDVYRELKRDGTTLLVDSGLRKPRDAERLLAAGVDRLIIALETLSTPSELRELTRALRHGDWIFSLDMKQGKPLASGSWPDSPVDIARLAVDAGAGSILVLDLASVGSRAGPARNDLLRIVRDAVKPLPVLTGGGVRNVEDLRALQTAGASGVLVASALHDGTIRPEDLDCVIK